MELKVRLIQERKVRGLSQEELAVQIGVSRQAVSKWETGDALPDLPKLMALADTLNISMDALCGREISSASPSPEIEAAPAKSRLFRRIANFALIGFLVAGSFFAGTQFDDTPELGTLTPSLPETFSVSGEQFFIDNGNLSYQFVPSITGEAYTYQITFSGQNNSPQTFTAPYSGGICTDTVVLSETDTYSVTVVVSNVQDSRAVALASGLNFSKSSGSVQWTPIE
ncbi:MAG: helix-turn-helix domain-containing protein [Oscillospiraceae bacterium]